MGAAPGIEEPPPTLACDSDPGPVQPPAVLEDSSYYRTEKSTGKPGEAGTAGSSGRWVTLDTPTHA